MTPAWSPPPPTPTAATLPLVQAAEAAELLKFEAAKQRALAQRDVQFRQLDELKVSILKARAEDKAEGQTLKKKAQQEAEELIKKEQARIDKVGSVASKTQPCMPRLTSP